MDQLQALPVLRIQLLRRLGEDVLDRSQHQSEWRAKLVADVAEEDRLGAIQFGQRFGSLSLFLVSARVRDGRRDARGGEVEEVAIVAGQPEVPAHAGHQRAHDLSARRDG